MPETPTKHDAKTFLANDFVSLLRCHDKGDPVKLLEDDLHKVVAAVKEHGKKGSMKIEVIMEPSDDEEMMTVSIKSSLNLPRPGAPKRTYFTTDENGLSRHHPDQLSLLDVDGVE